jgi:hypothetical protein
MTSRVTRTSKRFHLLPVLLTNFVTLAKGFTREHYQQAVMEIKVARLGSMQGWGQALIVA